MRDLMRGIILELIIIAMPSWMRKGIGSLLIVLGLGLTTIGLLPLIGSSSGDLGWGGLAVLLLVPGVFMTVNGIGVLRLGR
ncbi:MAG: hypothetical protein VYD89_04545 [Candidatus Thermoplasmatota archaeon]|nr:hypothetical protein [Candidatus Thermoplasmatota archaeon]